MKKELLNRTNYADIYGIRDDAGALIGTMEIVIAGRNVGTYYTSWNVKYNKRDIRRMFKELQ